jgi:hypothetical protein
VAGTSLQDGASFVRCRRYAYVNKGGGARQEEAEVEPRFFVAFYLCSWHVLEALLVLEGLY